MSEREKAKEIFVKEAQDRMRWDVIFELIDHLNHALGQFPKSFSAMELAIACQHLVIHHAVG